MSSFSTVQPRDQALVEVTTTQVSPPMWVSGSLTVLTCLLPVTLVVLYWMGRLRCDRVISLTVWSYVLASLMALAWFAPMYK